MASPARWIALLSYLLLQCIGLGIAWWLLLVPRAPLPHEEIAALADAIGVGTELPWPRPTIRVSSLPGAFRSADESHEFARILAEALGTEAAHVATTKQPPQSLEALSSCALSVADAQALDACLQGTLPENIDMQSDSSAPLLDATFDLLVAPAGSSTHSSALLLDSARGAVLQWRREDQAFGKASGLAKAVAGQLKETWFRRATFENGTSLFEVAPAYVFSFYLVGDCTRRVTWDFLGAVLGPYMGRFLHRLRLLVDLEMDSQVVQCGSLGGSSAVVTASALRADFLRQAGEWPGDTVTRGARWLPPLIRFVAFKPSTSVQVRDDLQQSQRSFAVQGWGAVSIVGGDDDDAQHCSGACSDVSAEDGRGARADVMAPCEAQQAASAWVATLRSWLKLTPDARVMHAPLEESGLALYAARPSADGIAS
eukprot:CAMPEP_0115507132 /NCGR_PEP_ID=MMETSP0271-20121206/71555_1 /TAXON_ID=71861 /ORGANISM="Scrippsiella trochoidea, Strain CCMP3099" /LENGTH=426 /DNA_ID=CAMNT_0002936687 /DNA_START=1 /DNA_END=1277 /DNA_ORIENTATION=+